MKMKYELVDYFDVWGNCRDGYEINDQRIVGTVELPDNPTKQDFLNAAIEAGILKYNVTLGDVIIEGYGDTVEILDPNPREPEEIDQEETNAKEPLPICGFIPLD